MKLFFRSFFVFFIVSHFYGVTAQESELAPVLLIVGTRPEGIKMIPVYHALKEAGIPTILCSTSQHSELLTQVFDLFAVKPDIDFAIMRPGQDLFYVTESILQKTKEVIQTIKPSLVLVQGDTTTTMAAALAAFYLGIPVGHVEAGLRTGDMTSPFPEEMNRRFVALIAQYHFAPTAQAAANLLAEGVARNHVFCTGNTVVDALRLIKNKIDEGAVLIEPHIAECIAQCHAENKKIMLLTAHRRESFNGGIAQILHTVKDFLHDHPDVFCMYPYHPNPAVLEAIETMDLSEIENMYCCEPLSYKDLVYLLLHADCVATDSGGIQEEAVSLGKQVLVLREKSERMEGVWEGAAQLLGTDPIKIKAALDMWIDNPCHTQCTPMYGDGYAAQRIAQIISQQVA